MEKSVSGFVQGRSFAERRRANQPLGDSLGVKSNRDKQKNAKLFSYLPATLPRNHASSVLF